VIKTVLTLCHTQVAWRFTRRFVRFDRIVFPESSDDFSFLIRSSNTDAGSYSRPSRRAGSVSVGTSSPRNALPLGKGLPSNTEHRIDCERSVGGRSQVRSEVKKMMDSSAPQSDDDVAPGDAIWNSYTTPKLTSNMVDKIKLGTARIYLASRAKWTITNGSGDHVDVCTWFQPIEWGNRNPQASPILHNC
jgi:hypothetical protein